MTYSKPITEIFLRVRGELRQLNQSLLNLDKDDIFKHRVSLDSLLNDLRASLRNIEHSSTMSYLVSTASNELIVRCETTLCNASRYLSTCLRQQSSLRNIYTH